MLASYLFFAWENLKTILLFEFIGIVATHWVCLFNDIYGLRIAERWLGESLLQELNLWVRSLSDKHTSLVLISLQWQVQLLGWPELHNRSEINNAMDPRLTQSFLLHRLVTWASESICWFSSSSSYGFRPWSTVLKTVLMPTTEQDIRVSGSVTDRPHQQSWRRASSSTGETFSECFEDDECLNFCSKLHAFFYSINTHNGCIRLWSGDECTGSHLDIAPGTPSHHDIPGGSQWNKTASIGSCTGKAPADNSQTWINMI